AALHDALRSNYAFAGPPSLQLVELLRCGAGTVVCVLTVIGLVAGLSATPKATLTLLAGVAPYALALAFSGRLLARYTVPLFPAEHPGLPVFGTVPDRLTVFLHAWATPVARFRAFDPERITGSLFDPTDANYLPLRGFRPIERPGPSITVWRVREGTRTPRPSGSLSHACVTGEELSSSTSPLTTSAT